MRRAAGPDRGPAPEAGDRLLDPAGRQGRAPAPAEERVARGDGRPGREVADERPSGLALALLAVACLALGCKPAVSTGPPPTDVEALAFLHEAVELAQAGRFEELCAVGGGNCESTLSDAGRDAVPADPPVVIGTWLVSDAPTNGAVSTGGRILEVCGVDGRQRVYRTQILVFREGDKLRAIEPVYWSGIKIATGNVVGPKPTPSVTCPGLG